MERFFFLYQLALYVNVNAIIIKIEERGMRGEDDSGDRGAV